jgi:hypothetical protein
MGAVGCPETSGRNYHYTLRNNPESAVLNSHKIFRLGKTDFMTDRFNTDEIKVGV